MLLLLLTPPLLMPVAQVTRPVLPDPEKRFLSPPEELLAGVLPQLTPAQHAALQREFGPYLGQPAYPASVALRLIDWSAAVAYPTRPLSEGRWRRGRDGLLAWRHQTLRGRLLTAAFPLLGLDRILRRMPHNFAVLTNFGTRAMIHAGPQHWWYTARDDPIPPEFTAGIFEAVSTFTSVRGLTIHWEAPTSHERVLEIRWDP